MAKKEPDICLTFKSQEQISSHTDLPKYSSLRKNIPTTRYDNPYSTKKSLF